MSTYTNSSPTKDNFMQQNAPNDNNGTSANIYITDLNSSTYRTLIEFDITDFPGGTISSAICSLYYNGNIVGTDGTGKTVLMNKLTRTNWDETLSSWNNYTTGTGWTSAGGDFVTSSPANASNTIPGSTGYLDFDITSIVNDAITNTSSLVELLVKFSNEVGGGTWSLPSFDSRSGTNKPKLVITYTAASGPTNLKTINGLAKASIKTYNSIAIASIKSINGLT